MEMTGADIQELRFYLDEDVIPQSELAQEVPYINNGKQITRNHEGLWICLFTFNRNYQDRNFLALAVSEKADTLGSEFCPPIMLVGKVDPAIHPLFEYQGERLGNSCLFMGADGRLHVIFEQEDGLYLLTCDAAGHNLYPRLSLESSWSGPEKMAREGSLLGDVSLLSSGKIILYYTLNDVLYEKIHGGTAKEICKGVQHPSVYTTNNSIRHIAFERDRRIFYIRSEDGAQWGDTKGNPGPEMVACFCSSWPSIAVTAAGKVVIAYQGEGKVDLKRIPDLYRKLRPAGGSTISYAVFSKGKWSIHDLARSREILLKRRLSGSGMQGKSEFKPCMEEMWRPSLAVDIHGVIWMFFINTTRRHIFCSRFHGENFSDLFEARGPYDCLSRIMFVQKESRDLPGIGFLTLAADQFYFDCLPVPEYTSTEKRRVVFLDNLEVDEMIALEHKVGMWQKHPDPIFGKGISGDSMDDDIAACQVRKVKDGFEMNYMSQGTHRSNGMPGRAFSKDGIHWQKRPPFDNSRVALDGKPFPNEFWRPIYLEDPAEKDPMRRYKGLFASYQYKKGIQIRSWVVVASPDGLVWHTVKDAPRVVLGDISVNYHLIRDDEDKNPERRYKVAMHVCCSSGRAVCVFTSPDLIHWNRVNYLRENPDMLTSSISPWPTGPLAIDPDAAENPWEEEVHDGVMWRENGILMFHYDAFYFGANQHTNKALAISRDGRHYYRIKRGAVNMPHGNCGEWDSGRDRTSIPIRMGNELWLYFCGMPASHFSDADKDNYYSIETIATSEEKIRYQDLRPWRVGMAGLRVDGWAYVQLEREARSGYLTTIPFDYKGGELVVNGCGLGEGGIRIEMRTADNISVVEGFEQKQCRFSSSEGVTSRVTWKSGKTLHQGRYRLRFIFEGLHARLYSFGFE